MPQIPKMPCITNSGYYTYRDTVLCDVTEMDATHLMLGRPWQYDRRIIHDGYLNTYMFKYHAKRITLLPMTPSEALQDEAERQRAKAVSKAQPGPSTSSPPKGAFLAVARGSRALLPRLGSADFAPKGGGT